MTKVLVIGDTHFRYKYIDVGNSLIKICTKLAYKKNPDFIVLLGDILHTHSDLKQSEFDMATRMIESLSKDFPLYVIMGNHDYINPAQFLSDKHFFNPFKKWDNVTIVDHVIHENINGHDFLFCPYVDHTKFILALETSDFEWKKASCIFTHIDVQGAKSGDFNHQGIKWKKRFPFTVSGHIHINQRVGKKVYYPGSSTQVSSIEDPNKVVAVLTFKNKIKDDSDIEIPNIKEYPVLIQGVKTVKCDIDNIDDLIVDETHTTKIKLICSEDEFQKFRMSEKMIDLVDKKVIIEFEKTDTIDLIGKDRFTGTCFTDIFHQVVSTKSKLVQSLAKELF